MANAVKRGTSDPLPQFWEQRWGTHKGGETTQVWKGIDIAKMSALAQTYVDAGFGGTLRFEKDVATFTLNTTTLDVSGGGSSPFRAIVDKWEVGTDQEKPDLMENATFLSIVKANDNAGVTGYNLRSKQIIRLLKQHCQGDSTNAWGDFYTDLTAATSLLGADGKTAAGGALSDGINVLGAAPNLKLFFDDYARGATNFLHGKCSLKHTTIAPSNYASNVADFNVEKIYTIAGLLSEAQSGLLWILPLPSYLAFKLNAYPVPVTVPANYQYGALKQISPATTMARGRIEIVTEYLIDTWPIHTYGLAS